MMNEENCKHYPSSINTKTWIGRCLDCDEPLQIEWKVIKEKPHAEDCVHISDDGMGE